MYYFAAVIAAVLAVMPGDAPDRPPSPAAAIQWARRREHAAVWLLSSINESYARHEENQLLLMSECIIIRPVGVSRFLPLARRKQQHAHESTTFWSAWSEPVRATTPIATGAWRGRCSRG